MIRAVKPYARNLWRFFPTPKARFLRSMRYLVMPLLGNLTARFNLLSFGHIHGPEGFSSSG